MIVEQILTLIDEVEFIEELHSEDVLSRFDNIAQNPEQLRKAGEFVKTSSKNAIQMATSLSISQSGIMAGHSILGPIIGSFTGGIVSSIIISLIVTIIKYKKEIANYAKQLVTIKDPQEKQKLQSKINELKQKINEKKTRLNQEKTDLNKEIGEMRLKISEMERNRNQLSPSQLQTLDKYKKDIANKMKVLPKLNV